MIGLEHCRGDDLLFLCRAAFGVVEQELTMTVIQDAVAKAGSIKQAAKLLGVARSTVQRRFRRATSDPAP